MKKRIWELDALRGLCLLCMIVIHFVFDLGAFAGLQFTTPGWFDFLQTYGHIFFILISGICATLASRSFRRGVIVFAAGLLVSAVTVFMEFVLKFRGLSIYFGILHLLGLCMMLYPPVSYTHLDVYKRQQYNLQSRLASTAIPSQTCTILLF